jgi:hypothetical protein
MATRRSDDQLSDEIRALARKSEAAVEQAGHRLATAVRSFLPEASADARKFMDEAFDYLESALRSQRDFVHSVLDTVGGRSGTKSARPARKTATASGTARKSARKQPTRPRKSARTG